MNAAVRRVSEYYLMIELHRCLRILAHPASAETTIATELTRLGFAGFRNNSGRPKDFNPLSVIG
jgi:hypothetical protein